MGIQVNRVRIFFRIVTVIALAIFATVHLIRYRRSKLTPSRLPEMGYPGSAGYHEFMEVDRMLTERPGDGVYGNTKQAARLAGEMKQQVMNIPGQGQATAVYCLVYHKYCIFVLDVPGLSRRRQTDLAKTLWPQAQRFASAAIEGFPTVGLGLRDEGHYGLMLIGGKVGKPIFSQDGGRYLFYPYFAGEPSLRQAIATAPEQDGAAE